MELPDPIEGRWWNHYQIVSTINQLITFVRNLSYHVTSDTEALNKLIGQVAKLRAEFEELRDGKT